MQLKRLSSVLSVAHSWRALLLAPQVECALLTHWDSSTWGRGSCSTSTTSSSSSSSSTTDKEPDAIYTAGSSRASAGSARDALATCAATAVQAQHDVKQLLPPLLSAHILPLFVRCQRKLRANALILSHWFNNPLKAAAPGTKVPVKISLTVHPSDWDPDAYVSRCKPQLHSKGHNAALPPAPAAGYGGARVGADAGAGGFTLSVNASKRANGAYAAVARARDMPEGYAEKAYDVVLQEQVGPAEFILHLKPHSPDAPRQDAKTISPVGQGTGLQVFPGSWPALDCVQPEKGVKVARNRQEVRFVLPKILIVSQLPNTQFPTDLTLIINDLGMQGDQPDQHTMATLCDHSGKHDMFRLCVHHSHPLGAYVGRRIIRMALTPDRQLTVYLAQQQ